MLTAGLRSLKRWFNPALAREEKLADLRVDASRDGIAHYLGRTHALADGATWHEGFAYPDWERAYAWVGAFPDADRSAAWLAAQRAWCCWLAAQAGTDYRCLETSNALLVTAQDATEALATLDFLVRTQRRISLLLEEIHVPAVDGKEILIAFADDDAYYRYIAHFYPESGEYAMSSGMHINAGCGHFVVPVRELRMLEPVVVHEMTHSLVDYLPIPAWLNEGLAVNTEQRLTGTGPDGNTLRELQTRHRAFWTPELIQSFWNGRSYLMPDQGNELSYDLGRVLVHALGKDWPAFKLFVLDAHQRDAGAAAAHAHLHVDLGEFVRGFLGASDGDWAPDPARWKDSPEKGRFRSAG